MKKALVGLMALGLVLAFTGVSLAADEEPAVKEIKGDAACGHCAFKGEGGCSASVKVGDDVFALKASDKADEATRKLIASFKGAGKITPIVIKGVIKDKTILADSVAKVETKKEESTGGCGCN